MCSILFFYITTRSLDNHTINSIDRQNADLQEKQLWMKYTKHFRRLYIFEMSQTLNFLQLILIEKLETCTIYLNQTTLKWPDHNRISYIHFDHFVNRSSIL